LSRVEKLFLHFQQFVGEVGTFVFFSGVKFLQDVLDQKLLKLVEFLCIQNKTKGGSETHCKYKVTYYF